MNMNRDDKQVATNSASEAQPDQSELKLAFRPTKDVSEGNTAEEAAETREGPVDLCSAEQVSEQRTGDMAKPQQADCHQFTVSVNKLNVLPENPEEKTAGRFPSWLHRKLPAGGEIFKTNKIVDKYKLNTVCEEAKCPNRLECYTKKTATFLALGKQCTRNCGFCDIDFS
ncbi:MAG TPA: hypothetical protein VHL30_04920, partial [Chlamydiales bacterium]|nr:hypothetical protein [Chlamydiales bacterium]